jgi:hypothetical protein
MNNQTILLVLAAGVLYYLMTKDKEGFRFADESTANAVYAQPSFPAPAALRNTPPVPQFETLGQMTGDNLIAKKATLTSDQVDAMLAKVGKGKPQLQDVKDIMPTPDMRYSAGLDPTDPNNFIYERTIFSGLKRRYGNEVDFIRGDLDIKPDSRGWFDTRSVGSKDVVKGYIASGYNDIQQQATLSDSIFERNMSASRKMAANTNPFGDVQGLVTSRV